jgi:translocation and assembly module TamA
VLSAALAAAPAAAAEYRVTMTSVEDPVLDKVLNASSTLIELQDRPPEDVTALRRRAEEDLGRLQKALRAAGYYDGTVTIKVDGQIIGDPAATPLQNYQDSAKRTLPVGISIAPGPLYKLGRITVTGAESLTPKLTLKLKTGAPARAADIVAERRTLLDQVMAAGHPFALATLKPATVDHAAHTLDIAFAVDPGPAATMGTVTVSGLDRVDKNFIAHRAWFPPGTKYSPAALDGLRGDLRSLDLFSSVKVKPGTALDAQGRLPVSVELVERERHFIGFGANYSTNDGAGATAYWGDRNLFGGGERLKLQADVSGIEAQGHGLAGADYTLTTNFRTPDFLTLHQDFVTNLVITDEHDPDTFDKRGLTLDTGVERKIGKTLKVNAGWEVEGARIDDHETTSNFLLDGPTGSIAWDTTNDLLNPTKGVRASLGGEAFPTWFGSNENVFTTKATASSYLNLIGSGDLVLAGRVGVASVFGSSLENLPADRRLYAGGGGSVRGYTFRSISPKDSDGNLSGGRSEIDGSIELRYRFLDNFGIVPFFDAGTVSRHAMPGFDQPVQYAAGIGFRYYTNFGPIRADIATPLNPRKGDDPVAFYVSIGQSF